MIYLLYIIGICVIINWICRTYFDAANDDLIVLYVFMAMGLIGWVLTIL